MCVILSKSRLRVYSNFTFSIKRKGKEIWIETTKKPFMRYLGYKKMIYYTPELLRKKTPTITGWKGTIIFTCVILSITAVLGQVQTPYFTWAESNANEQNPLFSLICIRFGSCEVRRLNLALEFTPFQLTFSKKKEKKVGLQKNKRSFYEALGYKKMIYYTHKL